MTFYSHMSTSFSSHITLSIPSSYQSLVLFSFLLFCHLKILCKWDMLYNLGDWLFSLRINSLRWSQIFVYIVCLFFFNCWVVLHGMGIPQFVYLSPSLNNIWRFFLSLGFWWLQTRSLCEKSAFIYQKKKLKKQKTAQEGNYEVVFLLHFIIMSLSL